VIKTLNDIQSPDELGQIWGLSGAHGVAHNDLGGEMGGFASVEDPAFMLWHFGVIEQNRDDWLATASGQAWVKTHPSGWTDPGANVHSMMAMAAQPLSEEELQNKINNAPPLWPMGQVFEAGVGFRDEQKRRMAEDNVKQKPNLSDRMHHPQPPQ
jgi:hypothetical protein